MSNFNAIVFSRIAKVPLVQGYGCVKDGVNTVDLPDADNELCAGIVEYSQDTAGNHVGVQHNGSCDFAVAGAAINDGDQVILDSTGRFIPLPGPVVAETSYNVVGIAQKAASAAGKFFELVILQRVVVVAAA